jgi:lactate racemase
MQIHLPYGRATLSAEIPDDYPVEIIEAPNPAPAPDPRRAVEDALDDLIGDIRWDDFRAAQSVAIAVNDKTRPVPHDHLLPPLMARLESLGIPDSAITFYIAVGTHPPMTPDEFPGILPAEILSRYRVLSHDSENDDLLTPWVRPRAARRSGQIAPMSNLISRLWWATLSRISLPGFRAESRLPRLAFPG